LFGWSVALHQTTLIVGAPGAASGGVPQSGRAFVYERGPAGWSLLQALNNPTPNLFDQFGWAVGVYGRTVAAGTPFDTINGIATTGATYTFAKSDGAYAPQQTITSIPALENQHFGNAVALANGRLLVGAEIALAEQGRAYRFSQLNPKSWTQVAQYKDEQAGDQPWFGCAVALSDFAVIGARRDDEVALDAGAAFVFAIGQ
jgi:FG-GAP repeat protein